MRSTMSGRSTRSCFSTSIRRRPLRRVLVEQRLDERGLAGAARAGEQHVVGGIALDELARVLLDQLLLRVDALQVAQAMRCTCRTGSIAPRPLRLAPAEGDRRASSRCGGASRGSSCSRAARRSRLGLL